MLGGLLGLAAGCAENVVTLPDLDLTGARPSDMAGSAADGQGSGSYGALVDETSYLTYQPGQPAADQWRERPRDASLAVLAGQTPAPGQLYFAASSKAGGGWSLGRLSLSDATVGPANGQTRGAVQMLTPQAGTWFAGDILAPTATTGAMVRGRKVALYFAATGSSVYPDGDRSYVSQIGLMTSDDGVSFTAEPAPVLTPPAWNGQAPALPLTPDSHGVSEPSLVSFNGKLMLFYTGLSCDANKGCRFTVLMRTTADGVTFGAQKVVRDAADAPGGAAGASAVVVDGRLLLAYTVIKKQPSKGRDLVQQTLLAGEIALASSTDGATFTDLTRTLVSPHGDYAGGVGRPFLYQDSGGLRLLFNGTPDVTQPGVSVYRATLLRQ